MYRGNSSNPAIPAEYRKAAERLFPASGFLPGKKPDLKTVSEFAKALGISVDYQRLLALNKSSGDLAKFLDGFQNNLDLLIRKTWVEKNDEKRKGKLQNEIPTLMTTIEQGNYTKAIEEFGGILDELAYLFFGGQSEKEDFTTYTFRIDAQMGLFWWYGGKLVLVKELNDKSNIQDEKVLWAILLLGLCYLTNF